MIDLLLNKPLCDWLTGTSWEPLNCGEHIDREVPEKRMQYDGYRSGSLFVGQALIGGFVHHMMQVSGAAADLYCYPAITTEPKMKATRIDIQMTVFHHKPDMRALYNRLAEKWQTSSFVTSKTGDTIYVGSWKSERFTRIYQKDNRRLLRMEMCWKGEYAEGARIAIAADETTIDYEKRLSRWLKYEVLRLDDSLLDFAFLPHLVEGEEKPVRRHTHESEREKWIRKIVLPSLEKYVNDHDADISLINALLAVLDDGAIKWGERQRRLDDELSK